MIKIERILCPVDLSESSDKSLRYAAALARAYSAKLSVCHCVGEPAATAGTLARQKANIGLKEAVASSLQIHVGLAGLGAVDWESVTVEGERAAEALTREALAENVDLIVMCSRRRPLRAALLGSTTEQVYRSAPCPVLVTHPDQREWTEDESGIIRPVRILVAHDFSDYSELALTIALSFAQEYQAELHLLHVLEAPVLVEPELAWGPSSVEGTYHKAARGLQNAVHGEAYMWCKAVKHAVRWGKPYREVLSYAREQEIDLICMGAHGTGFGIQTLFGSNVDRVVRQSPCPTLVARPLRPSGSMPLKDGSV
ncbi:MAG TPA: universal stress protein [Pyrinomonadaceae bacterium]